MAINLNLNVTTIEELLDACAQLDAKGISYTSPRLASTSVPSPSKAGSVNLEIDATLARIEELREEYREARGQNFRITRKNKGAIDCPIGNRQLRGLKVIEDMEYPIPSELDKAQAMVCVIQSAINGESLDTSLTLPDNMPEDDGGEVL